MCAPLETSKLSDLGGAFHRLLLIRGMWIPGEPCSKGLATVQIVRAILCQRSFKHAGHQRGHTVLKPTKLHVEMGGIAAYLRSENAYMGCRRGNLSIFIFQVNCSRCKAASHPHHFGCDNVEVLLLLLSCRIPAFLLLEHGSNLINGRLDGSKARLRQTLTLLRTLPQLPS